MISKTISKYSPYFFLFFINLLFFASTYFSFRVFFFGDTLSQRIPSMVLWKQEVKKGNLPLWNPYIFAGIPHLADLSTNTLSPFNLIYLVISNPFLALSFLSGLLVFLSSVFAYLFLQKHQLKPASCLLGTIVFAYSGTTLAAVNDINSLMGIALIPLVFLTLKNLTDQPTKSRLAYFVISLFFQFVSGHPQYSYYTWIITAIYLLVFYPAQNIRKIKLITSVFVLFFLLSSIQLLPFLELSRLTYRPQTTDFYTQNSLEFLDLPQLVLGRFYGSWKTGDSWGPRAPLETGRANTEGYLGIIPLILVLLFLKNYPKNKTALFYLGLAFTSIILSFGPVTPLFHLTQKILPLFYKFRSPIRMLSLYTFAVSVIFALSLDQILKTPTK